ncbi:S8 family peptidase [Amycolatopsis mediterranei]|uniref:S8 family peptidase n=1 Tax=Amycolatopsis mediterranei TaxID=33910 RepID=UPI003438DAD5
MPERDRQHLIVPSAARAAGYRPPPLAIGSQSIPAPADRRQHGRQLRSSLEQAESDGVTRREATPVRVEGAVEGVYVSFESFPGVQLALNPLDPKAGRVHPELMSVQQIDIGDGELRERATVFVPQGTMGYFLDRVSRYVDTAGSASPRHRDLLDRVASVRAATIAALWTDPPQEYPGPEQSAWWEVWLRTRDGREVERLRVFARQTDGVRLGRQSLGFGDRTVVLVQATAEQLASAVDVLDDLAELRRPHQPTQFLADHHAVDQREWVEELLGRLASAGPDAPAVCVVDTGGSPGHPLLSASLDEEDCHTADPNWSVLDHEGHGTEMAGLALYRDLGAAFEFNGPVSLRHRLESVRLLPPSSTPNDHNQYGAITAAGTSRPEIQAPDRRRVYSMAITAPWRAGVDGQSAEPVLGQPTSWSATLDALATGRSVVTDADGLVYLDEPDSDAGRRLFVVSAGNIGSWAPGEDHLTRSELEPVEDPSQAWNVLTVGAYTELDSMTGAPAAFDGWRAWAPRGELSPVSRTSMPTSRTWPAKPDVVLEGGNVAVSPDGTTFDTPDNLRLLTTNAPLISTRLLTTTHATSAATAQASALAAAVMAEYPALWPETVRALIVHSAEWTDAMQAHLPSGTGKRPRINLLRRYGMGVPDLGRALHSATDALTLVVQDVIHPFARGAMREIHYHELPWPSDVLAGLGEAQVRLKVTLSYFIEPNPGRRGWRRRYSYSSHGLRFDLRRPTESNAEFEKRINQLALAEDEQRPTPSDETGEWFFGTGASPRARFSAL